MPVIKKELAVSEHEYYSKDTIYDNFTIPVFASQPAKTDAVWLAMPIHSRYFVAGVGLRIKASTTETYLASDGSLVAVS